MHRIKPAAFVPFYYSVLSNQCGSVYICVKKLLINQALCILLYWTGCSVCLTTEAKLCKGNEIISPTSPIMQHGSNIRNSKWRWNFFIRVVAYINVMINLQSLNCTSCLHRKC